MKEALRIAHVRQRLGVAEMSMHIHEPDLAAKERRSLRALEQALAAAVVRQRAIEQTYSVGPAEMRIDETQVLAHLVCREHVLEYRVNHCERAVAHTGRGIARMKQIADAAAIFEERVAGEHTIPNEQPLKVVFHLLRRGFERDGIVCAADAP